MVTRKYPEVKTFATLSRKKSGIRMHRPVYNSQLTNNETFYKNSYNSYALSILK